jgi:hypothetical protein
LFDLLVIIPLVEPSAYYTLHAVTVLKARLLTVKEADNWIRIADMMLIV